MPHVPEPELLPERSWYYGWVMMPVAGIMIMATLPGQTVVVSQFNTAIRGSLGLSEIQLSQAYFIGTVLASLPLTLVGRLSDRIGPRRTTALVVGGFALGMLAMANARGFVTLTLGFLLIRFLGQGALGMLSSHVLALWFERRLATVESIKHAAMGVAGFVAPAAVIALIAAVGWREAYAWLAVIVAAAVLPLVATVFRDRPEDLGQHLDNERPAAHQRWRSAHEQNEPARLEPAFTLRQALGTRVFWLLLLPGLFSGSVGTAMLFHIQPILTPSLGDDAIVAGTRAVSTWSIVLPAGLLVGGVLADRLQVRGLASAGALLVGAGASILSGAGSSAVAAVAMAVFAVGMGLGMAAISPAYARYFGRPHHGAIRGVVSTAMVAGTAAGPVALAWAASLAASGERGDFGPGLIVCGLLGLPVAAISLLIRPPVVAANA
ncbi:MAG: MFS transporter [Planctomycetota bacterium]